MLALWSNKNPAWGGVFYITRTGILYQATDSSLSPISSFSYLS